MFSIKLNSGVPIYRQVVEQILRQIDRGTIEYGAMLPSVRQLATELGVNPMTISKAYGLLESDGVVERRRGIGMVVLKQAQAPEEVLRPSIENLIHEARQLGITEKQVAKMIQKQWKQK